MTTNPLSTARLDELIAFFDSHPSPSVQAEFDAVAALTELRDLRQCPADAALPRLREWVITRAKREEGGDSYARARWQILRELHDEIDAAIASSPPPEPQPRAYTDEAIEGAMRKLANCARLEGMSAMWQQHNPGEPCEIDQRTNDTHKAADRLRSMLRGVTKPPEPQQPATAKAVAELEAVRGLVDQSAPKFYAEPQGVQQFSLALCVCIDKRLAALRADPKPAPAASDAPAAVELREAAQALAVKLRIVHSDPRYIGVWTNNHIHGGRYDGPTYTDELAALEAALAASPPADAEPEKSAPPAPSEGDDKRLDDSLLAIDVCLEESMRTGRVLPRDLAAVVVAIKRCITSLRALAAKSEAGRQM